MADAARALGIDPESRSWKDLGIDVLTSTTNAATSTITAAAQWFDPTIGKDVDKLGELASNARSVKARVADEEFAKTQKGDGGEQFSGAIDYVLRDPVRAAGQAIGSLYGPGLAAGATRLVTNPISRGIANKQLQRTQALGPASKAERLAAEKAGKRVGDVIGLNVQGALSGAMNGGEAARDAYQRVFEATGDHEKAMMAAREARLFPTMVGYAGGLVGVDRFLATGKVGNMLKAGAIEGGTEAAQGGSVALSSNKAVAKHVPDTDIMEGVYGSAALEGVLGGALGAGTSILSSAAGPPNKDEDSALGRAINNTDTDGGTQRRSSLQSQEEQARQRALEIKQKEAEAEAAKQAAAAQQAAAGQAQTPQTPAGQQTPQGQQPTAQDMLAHFGIDPEVDRQTGQPSGNFRIGGKTLFGEQQAMEFAKEMQEAGKDLSPVEQEVIGKMFQSESVPVFNDDSAKVAVNKAKRFLKDNGLTGAQSVEEVTKRLDTIFANTAPDVDFTTDNKRAANISKLDGLYKTLTGEGSSIVAAEAARQMELKTQKEQAKTTGKAKATKATKATKVAKKDDPTAPGPVTIIKGDQAANTGEGNEIREPNTTGVGEVSEPSTAGTADGGVTGSVGSTGVQSEQSGSVAQGSDGQQNDTGRAVRDEQRANQPATAAGTAGTQATQEEVDPTFERYSALTEDEKARVSEATKISREDLTFRGIVANNAARINEVIDRIDQAKAETQSKETDNAAEGQSDTRTGAVAQGGRAVRDAGGVGRSVPAGGTQGTVSATPDTDTAGESAAQGRDAEQSAGQEKSLDDISVPDLFKKFFDIVIIQLGGNKGAKTAEARADYFSRYFGTPATSRELTPAKFAKLYDNLKPATVASWRSDLNIDPSTGLPRIWAMYNDRVTKAIDQIASEYNTTPEAIKKKLLEGVAENKKAKQEDKKKTASKLDQANESDTDTSGNDVLGVSSEEGSNFVKDSLGKDGNSGSNLTDRKTSVGEVTVGTQWLELVEKLEKAEEEGRTREINKLRKQLKELEGKAKQEGGQAQTEIDNAREEKINEGSREKAAEKWDSVVAEMPGAPLWEQLTEEDQDTFFEFGPKNWTNKDVMRHLDNIMDDVDDGDGIANVAATQGDSNQPAKGHTTSELTSALKRGDVRRALEAIEQDEGFSQQERLLAQRLLQDPNGLPTLEMVGSLVDNDGNEVDGQYNAITDQITLVQDKANSHTFLHEMVHAFVHRYILENEKARIKPTSFKRLQDLYNYILEKHPDMANEYGMQSLSEFASEAMSNRQFQNRLLNTPYKGNNGNLFTRFVRAIQRILESITGRPTDNAFFASLVAVEGMLDAGRDVQSERTGLPMSSIRRKPVILTTGFRKWFAGSKIAYHAGLPKLYFHGTARDIHAFRAKQAGAIFASPRADFAEDFAESSLEYMIKEFWNEAPLAKKKQVVTQAVTQYNQLLDFYYESGFLDEGSLRRNKEGVAGLLRRSPLWRKNFNGQRVWVLRLTSTTDLEFRETFLDILYDDVLNSLESRENIIPVFISAKNPFDYDVKENVHRVMKVLRERFPKELEVDQNVYMLMDDVRRAIEYGNWRVIENAEVQKVIRELGFDSFHMEEDGVKNIAVYDPAQIKSVFNDGTFSQVDDAIAFVSAGPKADKSPETVANYAKARTLLSNGSSPEQVFKETGWYQGTDGGWRFEIPDNMATFTQSFDSFDEDMPYPLSEVFDHPELYAAYPELEDVTFEIRRPILDIFQTTQGWFNPKTNTIAVTPYAQDPLSTLIHEVQHWVQREEGFSGGANPANMSLANTESLEKLRRSLEAKQKAHDEGVKPLSTLEKWEVKDLIRDVGKLESSQAEIAGLEQKLAQTKADEKQARRARDDYETMVYREQAAHEEMSNELRGKYEQADQELRKAESEYDRDRGNLEKFTALEEAKKRRSQALDAWTEATYNRPSLYSGKHGERFKVLEAEEKAAREKLIAARDELADYLKSLKIDEGAVTHALYEANAGETEARNTQTRANMTAEERRESFPASTMDVDPEFQTIEPSAGKTMASELPPSERSKIERNTRKLPAKVRPYYRTLSTALSWAKDRARFTRNLINEASKYMPSAKRFMDLVGEQIAMRNRLLNQVEMIGGAFQKLSKKEQKLVNKLLMDSTRSGLWAFKPSWMEGIKAGEKVTVSPDLQDRYDNLSEGAQKVIREVFAHGFNTMSEMRAGAMEQARILYDSDIELAKRAGKPKEAAELEKKKSDALREFTRLFDVGTNKPYAPLRRFGNHVVVYRSTEYMNALNMVENPESFDPEEVNKARKELKKMESDPDAYQVHFRESGMQAEKLVEKLLEKYPRGNVMKTERDKEADYLYASPDLNGLMHRLRTQANRMTEDDPLIDSTRALNTIMTELQISLLSEQNARHAEHRRVEGGVEGAEENMMRSFHQHGLAGASLVASLHKSKDVNKSLEAMRNEARRQPRGKSNRASQLYNEIAARHADGLEVVASTLVDTALRWNSAWMLLSKPTYFLQNLMQTPMMTLPVLTGRYGARASVVLGETYNDVGRVMTGQNLTVATVDSLPEDIKGVIEELLYSGRLNVSLDQEMGERLRAVNPVSRVITKLQGVAERIEGINRVVTAATSYRLARENGRSHKDAVDYAGTMVYDTHGDYSNFNAPRIMRGGLGRVVFQFRKFQLIQIALLAKLLREMVKGETLQEKWIAFKSMGFLLGATFAMGGTVALPGFTAASWILSKAFGDEEEPQDKDAVIARMRRDIGNAELADFIIGGLPKSTFGFDGQPIFGGAGEAFSILPYTPIDALDRSTYMNMALGLAGPLIGSQGMRAFESLGFFADGEYRKGLTKILPTGAANIVRAIEMKDNGITRGTGTELVSPDDVTAFTAFMQAIGLRTNQLEDIQFLNRVTTSYEAFYRKRSQELQEEYREGFDKGDRAMMKAAQEQWMEMNESRKQKGFRPQPLSNLMRAPLNRFRYEFKAGQQMDRVNENLTNLER